MRSSKMRIAWPSSSAATSFATPRSDQGERCGRGAVPKNFYPLTYGKKDGRRIIYYES